MKELLFGMTAAMAIVANSAVREYSWDAANPSATLGADATVTLEAGSVTEMSLNVPEGDRVVLRGDGVAFASGAKIAISGAGKFVFSNDVAAAGAITVDGCVTNVTLAISPKLKKGE